MNSALILAAALPITLFFHYETIAPVVYGILMLLPLFIYLFWLQRSKYRVFWFTLPAIQFLHATKPNSKDGIPHGKLP